MRCLWVALGILLLTACSSSPEEDSQGSNVKVIVDRPGADTCVQSTQITSSTDSNNMPQGEVSLDVAPDGRIAASAKDLRFSTPQDASYNRLVWNGLYLSNNAGQSWTNRAFEEGDPRQGLAATITGAYGQPAGQTVLLDHETDPVVAFDRDGVLYSCGLAYAENVPGGASSVVVSRYDSEGKLLPGSTRFIGVEDDPNLFNDKNWLAVDRDSPAASTIVVASWRLFGSAPLLDGGFIAVSADGAETFGPPIRVPIDPTESTSTQFYQPLIGPDPSTGRKTLFLFYSRYDISLNLGLAKIPIDRLPPGTSALHAYLADPAHWTVKPRRLGGLRNYSGNGVGGSFRFLSFFFPAIDRKSGRIFVAAATLQGLKGARIVVSSSADGGLTFSVPQKIDDPDKGHQIMAAAATNGDRLCVLWYDSRNDASFAPFGPPRALDVYYAELDASLKPLQVLRLTPETQDANRPAFTQNNGSSAMAWEAPHDMERTGGEPEAELEACAPYGFIGDYIGLAVDARHAYAAWCDLRDVQGSESLCQGGGNCGGRRNQNVYFARIPLQN